MKKIITETEIMNAKTEVLRAALGICALEETDLFLRLEEIYWKGFKAALECVANGNSVSDNNAVHPDTARLNHVIAADHSIIGILDKNKPRVGTIESIHFIFENPKRIRGSQYDANDVRAAIDRSIAHQVERNAAAAGATQS